MRGLCWGAGSVGRIMSVRNTTDEQGLVWPPRLGGVPTLGRNRPLIGNGHFSRPRRWIDSGCGALIRTNLLMLVALIVARATSVGSERLCCSTRSSARQRFPSSIGGTKPRSRREQQSGAVIRTAGLVVSMLVGLLISAGGQALAAPPTVNSMAPVVGPDTGGTVVTITGEFFTNTTNVCLGNESVVNSVSFGGVDAPLLLPVTNTAITVTSPPGSGTVTVTFEHECKFDPSARDPDPISPVMKSEFTQFACGATMITSIAVSPCISAMMAMARSTSD